jgi:hypothetical protein
MGLSFVGAPGRIRRRKEAEAEYDDLMEQYSQQTFVNPYANLQNTMEDLTVNQQQAQFQAEQAQQSQANILQNLRGQAGGSGIAALAQSLARQQAQTQRQISTDIGRQETANQRAAAAQAGQLQTLFAQGEATKQQQEMDLLATQLGMSAEQLAGVRAEQLAAQAARAQATAQLGQAASIPFSAGGTGGSKDDGTGGDKKME